MVCARMEEEEELWVSQTRYGEEEEVFCFSPSPPGMAQQVKVEEGGRIFLPSLPPLYKGRWEETLLPAPLFLSTVLIFCPSVKRNPAEIFSPPIPWKIAFLSLQKISTYLTYYKKEETETCKFDNCPPEGGIKFNCVEIEKDEGEISFLKEFQIYLKRKPYQRNFTSYWKNDLTKGKGRDGGMRRRWGMTHTRSRWCGLLFILMEEEGGALRVAWRGRGGYLTSSSFLPPLLSDLNLVCSQRCSFLTEIKIQKKFSQIY